MGDDGSTGPQQARPPGIEGSVVPTVIGLRRVGIEERAPVPPRSRRRDRARLARHRRLLVCVALIVVSLMAMSTIWMAWSW